MQSRFRYHETGFQAAMEDLDEPVHIVAYDPAWPTFFLKERDRIAQVLSAPLNLIEHIGSTAVPYLSGKPIVDIMVGFEEWPPPEDTASTLVSSGYEALGEAGVPERLYFRSRGVRSYNLHLVLHNGKHWNSNIALRDYLRRDSAARDRYEQAKVAAIDAGARTLLSYSSAKSRILDELLRKAINV